MLPHKAFYMIRHGETEANLARITAGGQFDSPLTAKGRAQAQALSKVIASLEVLPEVIYHSDMQRARDTAAYLNQALNLEMHELHDLRERDCGAWDGLPWVDVDPRMTAGEIPPGGESDQQFAQRIQATLTDIIEKEQGRLVMVVAHGGLFHAMGTLYEYGMSSVQNCHLHYFEPCSEYAPFPWRAWRFDINGNGLDRSPAPFCLSQALEKMA